MKTMPNATSNDFQKQFIRLALRRLPHHFALYLAKKVHSRYFVKILDAWAKKHIIGSTKLQGFSSDEQKRYRSVASEAVLWHGTGRYQYSQGEAADVLERIASIGSIRPAMDAYAIFSGGNLMASISLTRLRIIARCYADMHGEGYLEPNRFGDALTWVSYHYGLFYARLYTIHHIKVRRYYKTWHHLTHDKHGHNTWGKKANQNARDVWDIFGLGSDIPGNYPIIFGIKNITDTIQLSSAFRDYEVRVGKNISLKNITHLEVPLAKIGITEALLAKHGLELPVLPIETGELIASQMPFSKLLGLAVK